MQSRTNVLAEERMTEYQAVLECIKSYEPIAMLPTAVQNKLALDIETGIYEHTKDKARERYLQISWNDETFADIYHNVAYGVKMNLDITSSVNAPHDDATKCYLVSRLYNHVCMSAIRNSHSRTGFAGLPPAIIDTIALFMPVIDPLSVGGANAVTLNPKINQIYLDEIALRLQQGVVMKYSTLYTCGNCKKKKTRYREIQSRSADEGGTLFVHCISCGHIWRQYS